MTLPPVSVLPVPYASQLGTGASQYRNDCGAACGVMLIEAYTGTRISVDAFYKMTGVVGDHYLSAADISDVLQRYGIAAKWFSGLTISDVFSSLSAQRPLIPVFNYGTYREFIEPYSSFTGAHFAVLMGIDTSRVYINDPLFPHDGGAALSVAHADWMKAWGDAIKQGNSPCGALIPDVGIGQFKGAAAPLYTGTVIARPYLNVRTTPSVTIGNIVGRLLPGDSVSIYREFPTKVGTWVCIDPVQNRWAAMRYGGQTYIQKE